MGEASQLIMLSEANQANRTHIHQGMLPESLV
jgi:hypothetical protein